MSDPQPKPRAARRKSRGHPFLRGRVRGVWYPDAVGVVNGYPKTQEAFDAKVELMRQQIKLYNAEGISTRRGVPDGYAGRRADLKKFRAAAEARAVKLVEIMTKNENIDDPRAVKALEHAVAVMEAKDDAGVHINKAGDRLVAARLVLDFTKSKPVQKSEVSIAKAEDFLAALARSAE